MNTVNKLSNTQFREKVLERFPFCSEAVINFNYIRYLSIKGIKVTKNKYSRLYFAIKAKFKKLDKKFLGTI